MSDQKVSLGTEWTDDRARYEAIYGAVSDEFSLRWKAARSVAEYEAVSAEAQAEIDRRYASVTRT